MKNLFFERDLEPGKSFTERFETDYSNTILNLPYNSAVAFHRTYGKSDRPRGNWGDNCIAQAVHIKRLYCHGDVPWAFLECGRHRVVVFWHAPTNNLVFMDPYVMHQRPISLNEIFLNPGKEFSYSVFPDAPGHVMRLKYDEQRNTLEQVKVMRHGTVTFSYDLTKLSRIEPNPYQEDLLFADEQDNLSIRVVAPDKGALAHCICPLKQLAPDYRSGKNPWIQWNARYGSELFSSDDPCFYDILSGIGDVVGASPTTIIRFLTECALCYLKNMPREITYERAVMRNASNL